MMMQRERLQRKLQQYYTEERDKGHDVVTSKYNATYNVLLYLLGLIEHYTQWEDMESIKSVLQHYHYIEMYSYDPISSEVLEREYQSLIDQKKTS